MKLYLISNNRLLENLSYNYDASLDDIRLSRPLSLMGEDIANKISEEKELQEVEKIYSSFYSSALGCAKYLAKKLELEINMVEDLNDCQVGHLGSKNMQMLKGIQEREFTYKLPGGESLIDVGNRLDKFIKSIEDNTLGALFTHKRAILGFILKYAKVGYNLDENLILEFKDAIIYDDSDTDYDIYEVEIENREIINIKTI